MCVSLRLVPAVYASVNSPECFLCAAFFYFFILCFILLHQALDTIFDYTSRVLDQGLLVCILRVSDSRGSFLDSFVRLSIADGH